MALTLAIMCDLLVMYNPPCRVQKCKVLSLISVLMHAFVTFAKLNLLCTKITVFLSICSLQQNSDLSRLLYTFPWVGFV
jgi:hypothetical protein